MGETVARATAGAEPVRLAGIETGGEDRAVSGCGEFDRVLGGGLVSGAVVLIGGSPGVGKSTLLLQIAAAVAETGRSVLYVSGEESAQQLKLRAERLGVADSGLEVLIATDLANIESALERLRPTLAVIDSVQTVRTVEAEASPGSITQVRECTRRLAELAKRIGTAALLVGHVTKDGSLAGPKVVEHIVDTVLMFEGETTSPLKVLRAVKNRYGSTNEVGLFEMTAAGLRETPSPTGLLPEAGSEEVEGTAVCCAVEGTRPLFLEVQALVAPTPFAAPRRVAGGVEANRLHLLLAVLEQRAGIRLGARDVYVNVAGGVRITEPAADLAVAMAVASSWLEVSLPRSTVVFGEVGLTGEVRPVHQTERRLEEAARLGFGQAVVAARNVPARPPLAVQGVQSLDEAVGLLRRSAGTKKERVGRDHGDD